MQKFHNCRFLKFKEDRLELVFRSNFCQLHFECIYKMLVACASNNEGRISLMS